VAPSSVGDEDPSVHDDSPGHSRPMPATPWFDPAALEVLADPHPTYDRLRVQSPLVPDPLGWSVLGYHACAEAFRSPAMRPGIVPLVEALGTGAHWGVPGRSLTDTDGGEHQRLRRVLGPWFTARRATALRDRVRGVVEQIAVAASERGSLDVVTDLADVVPALVFCWMAGAPEDDAPFVAELSKDLLLVFAADPVHAPRIEDARQRLLVYVQDLLADPAPDTVTATLAGAVRDGALEPGDDVALLAELASAAVDNTANTAAFALGTLAHRPAAWADLRRTPDAVGAVLEECMRFEPAIRQTTKVVTEPCTLAGVALDRGEFVTLRLAAAHRDPAVFADPHRFDPGRMPGAGQLSFGLGRHHCLGAALGRMELEEIVGGLARHAGQIAPLPGEDVDMHGAGVAHRLPIAVSPAS
jgi:cytochrome P450